VWTACSFTRCGTTSSFPRWSRAAFPLPCSSDGGGNVGSAYGVYLEDSGVEARGRFIIDPDGVVQGIEVLTRRWDAMSTRASVRSRPFSMSETARGRKPLPRLETGEADTQAGSRLVGKVWEVWKTIWPLTKFFTKGAYNDLKKRSIQM
jgi:peroxiredoxin (alkyl hydroperoxide reductase subunit C)